MHTQNASVTAFMGVGERERASERARERNECEVATRKTEEEWGGACALTKLIFCFLRGGKKKKDNGKLQKKKEIGGRKSGCAFPVIKNS